MTREEINKAAKERFPFPDGKIDFKIALRRSDFKGGAQWAAEQMFTRADMEAMYCIGLLNRGISMDNLATEIASARNKIDMAFKLIKERNK